MAILSTLPSICESSAHEKNEEFADLHPNSQDGNDDDAENEPKKSYGQRKSNGTQHAKGAKAKDSSKGKVAPEKVPLVAPKKKSKPG